MKSIRLIIYFNFFSLIEKLNIFIINNKFNNIIFFLLNHFNFYLKYLLIILNRFIAIEKFKLILLKSLLLIKST